MYPSPYVRTVARSVDVVSLIIMVLAMVFWIVTLADHYLGLHWGWDFQGVWLLPLIMLVGMVVRFTARAMFRFFYPSGPDDRQRQIRRFWKALGFTVLSVAYGAVSFCFLVMLAVGDCLAHDLTPPGRCWTDNVGPGTWATVTFGCYALMTFLYWKPLRRRSPRL
jgi:hypothetical protein